MGTPAFLAPELCNLWTSEDTVVHSDHMVKTKTKFSFRSLFPSGKVSGSEIDVWSFGVVLYCLTFGKLPFVGSNQFVIFRNIHNTTPAFPSTNFTSDLYLLIQQMLTKAPGSRPTMKVVKNSLWAKLYK